MSVALQHPSTAEVTLELTPGQSIAERQRLAVRDLREGSYLILEKLKNAATDVSPIRRKKREQPA